MYARKLVQYAASNTSDARVQRFTDYNHRAVFDPNGNLVKFTAYEQLARENRRLLELIQKLRAKGTG